MLSVKTQYSLSNAKEYFEKHLRAGDYFIEGEQIAGQWLGAAANRLGLSGNVKSAEFMKLCDNLDPRTGKRLTARFNTTRNEVDPDGTSRTNANRRVFYDFTISPPKSVSIMALAANDGRIVEAHDQAVGVALRELERFVGTRVRMHGTITDRNTTNFACAIFRHDTSRALDPHLHSHCIVFNATFDAAENRWKALQNFEMLRAKKYVENVYYHELARKLHRMGYSLDNHARGDFQINGVSKDLCDRFSKRHREINEKTQELLSRKTDLKGANLNEIRQRIAHKERDRKIKNLPANFLRNLWGEQLSPIEQQSLSQLKASEFPIHVTGGDDALTAIVWAEEHVFDRRSVVSEYDLWRHALEHARGQDVTLEEIHNVTKKRGYLRDEKASFKVTTREVLEREIDIVRLAKAGQGTFDALSPRHVLLNSGLDPEQRAAVSHILGSRDFITLFRGGAGTGKSYALKEVKNGLTHAKRALHVIAPQRRQVGDLERDGLTGAQTVSEFLTRRQMTSGAVVIVDEAGQIGAEQMHRLLRYVQRNGGRIILSGDTRQHGAVQTSDALRAIERYSGLKAAELKEIRRQDPALADTIFERRQIQNYRQAVKEASQGDGGASFRLLDEQGAIVMCSLADQQERLADEYVALVAQKHSVLVVSQTWSEVHKANDSIRSALKDRGLVGADEKSVTAFESVDLTDAQKRDRRFYGKDAVVVLNQKVEGFKKGQICRFVDIVGKGVILESENLIQLIPFKRVDRFNVCRPQEIAIGTGDRLQLKANAQTHEGKRIANGEIVTVEKVLTDGRIRLQDGRVLDSDYRQFVRGFATTSYASQGKTVDYVLFSDSAIKAATNSQQWYVSISRGRKGVRIFTSDKEQLRENILRPGERTLAMDLKNADVSQRNGHSFQQGLGIHHVRTFGDAIRQRLHAVLAGKKIRPERHSSGVKV